MGFDITLCADDYGMTEGVSRGILEAAVAGRLSSASAMTSMPDWPRAARDWFSVRPGASLGLHLNLTLGAPLDRMPGLAPANALPPLRTMLRARTLPQDEIRSEFVRQIDAFADHAGRLPAHVDGHQHVHMLRNVRDALFAALQDRGLAGVALRDSADAPHRILLRRQSAAKAITVAVAGRGFGRQARALGFACNEGFAGFSAFDPGADMTGLFARYLVAPGSDHLVMCHPGFVDDALRALDPVTDARRTELDFLLSPRFADLLAARGARLRRGA